MVFESGLPRPHMMAPEVRGDVLSGPERRRRLEHREEAMDIGAECGAGIVANTNLKDARHQQRPALYVAQTIPAG